MDASDWLLMFSTEVKIFCDCTNLFFTSHEIAMMHILISLRKHCLARYYQQISDFSWTAVRDFQHHYKSLDLLSFPQNFCGIVLVVLNSKLLHLTVVCLCAETYLLGYWTRLYVRYIVYEIK